MHFELKGKTFDWYVADGCVTVSAPGLGTKATQIGGSSPEDVAHMLAVELAGGADER